MRCAIYIRVSTVAQKEKGFSLDWQRKNLIDLAKTKDWKLEKRDMFDEGRQSGETISERPIFQKLLKAIGEGRYEKLLQASEIKFLPNLFGFKNYKNDCFNCYTLLIDENKIDGIIDEYQLEEQPKTSNE